jgi:hypothetical protein
MRRCPKCNVEYFDNMLEFCLEDGTRLTNLPDTGAVATAKPRPVPPTLAETVSFAAEKAPFTEVVQPQPNIFESIDAKPESRMQGVKARGYEVIEYVPIILALAHNWWQWLYLDKQNVSSITDYVLSVNFLMWLVLLISATAVSLFVIRSGTKKTLAYISLVILAINLILFLVPRR